MGVTQHRHGTENVQQIANLLLLRGQHRQAGRRHLPAARPLATCRATAPSASPRSRAEAFLERLDASVRLRAAARARAQRGRGGRGDGATARLEGVHRPGRQPRGRDVRPGGVLSPRSRKLDLAVQIATKLNRTHLLTAATQLILPCLGRTEVDEQAGGPQSVTVEDSMSMVHASARRPEAGLANCCARSPRSSRAWRGRRCRTAPIDWEGIGRRLRPHPRRDRGGVPGLRRLQRPHPRARRLPAARRGLANANGRRPTGKAQFPRSSPASTRMTGSTSTA